MFSFLSVFKNKKILYGSLAILILVAGGLIYYRIRSNSSSIKYTTAPLEKGTIISSISASGSISDSNFYNLKTSSSGIIKAVYIKDGQEVYKGQKLLEIDLDSDGLQTLNKAYASLLGAQTSYTDAVNNKTILENKLAEANSNFGKNKETLAKALNSAKAAVIQDQANVIYASGTRAKQLAKIALDSAKRDLEIAQQNYDAIGSASDPSNTSVFDAQNKFNNADSAIEQARVNLATAQLSYKESAPIVYAPIAGRVSGLSVFEGMSIVSNSSSSGTNGSTNSATQLLSVANQNNPLISIDISESEINQIKVDQKVNISLDAITDKTFTGKVVGINKAGTVSSNVTNYPVTILFDTNSGEILPNMSASVDIILDSKTDILKTSTSAISETSNGYAVQILVDGKPVSKEVKIGLSSDTETEIVSGLNEGDLVITATTSTKKTTTASGTSSVFGGVRSGANSLGSSGNARSGNSNFGPPN